MSGETLFYMALLALLIGGMIALYGFLLVRKVGAVWQSLRRLRDRIDGAKRWP